MPFQPSDRYTEEFQTQGFTVFRGILPPALIDDLRRVTDLLRERARTESHPQVARTGAVRTYRDVDQKPFRDYAELPALVDAVHRVLTPEHRIGTDEMCVLLEPRDLPSGMRWHRDWRHHMSDELFHAEFESEWNRDIRHVHRFNQINCPLWEDSSLWFVPGSHYRLTDTPAEMAARLALDDSVLRGNQGGRTYQEMDRLLQAYCEAMPGAVCLRLNAGDFALYRQTAWHTGCIAPHRKRATLNDHAAGPEGQRWIRDWLARRDKPASVA